jgi:hypothetical protein
MRDLLVLTDSDDRAHGGIAEISGSGSVALTGYDPRDRRGCFARS